MRNAVRTCEAPETYPETANSACDSVDDRIIGNDAPRPSGHPECGSHGENRAEISSKILRHGGPRKNAGGPRPNSGGPRPGAGRKAMLASPVLRTCGPRWYCVATWPGAEDAVIEVLKAGGVEYHFPLMIEDDSGVKRPVYSGYVFVLLDLDVPGWEILSRSKATPPRRLLGGSGERPSPVEPRGFVEGLIAAANEDGLIDARSDEDEAIEPGSAVKITEGPLAGCEAIVQHAGSKWVRVTVAMFGHHTTATMGRGGIEVI